MASPRKHTKILQDNLTGFTQGATLSVFKLAFLNPDFWNKEDRIKGRAECKQTGWRLNDVYGFRVSPDVVPLIVKEIEGLSKKLLSKVAILLLDTRKKTVTADDMVFLINRDNARFPFLHAGKGTYADLIASGKGEDLPRRYPSNVVRRYMIEILQENGQKNVRITPEAVAYMKYVIEAMVFFIARHARDIASAASMRTVQLRHVFLAVNILREIQGEKPRAKISGVPNPLLVGNRCTNSPRRRKRSKKNT